MQDHTSAQLTDRTGRAIRWGWRYACPDAANWNEPHSTGYGRGRKYCAGCRKALDFFRGTWAVVATSAEPHHVHGLADTERTFASERQALRFKLDNWASYAPLAYIWLNERDILEDAAAERLAAEPESDADVVARVAARLPYTGPGRNADGDYDADETSGQAEPVADPGTLAELFHAMHDTGQAYLSGRLTRDEYEAAAATLNAEIRRLSAAQAEPEPELTAEQIARADEYDAGYRAGLWNGRNGYSCNWSGWSEQRRNGYRRGWAWGQSHPLPSVILSALEG